MINASCRKLWARVPRRSANIEVMLLSKVALGFVKGAVRPMVRAHWPLSKKVFSWHWTRLRVRQKLNQRCTKMIEKFGYNMIFLLFILERKGEDLTIY